MHLRTETLCSRSLYGRRQPAQRYLATAVCSFAAACQAVLRLHRLHNLLNLDLNGHATQRCSEQGGSSLIWPNAHTCQVQAVRLQAALLWLRTPDVQASSALEAVTALCQHL